MANKIVPPFIRSPYNYDVKEASDASSYEEKCESLTVQSQAEDADINVIMYRYGITGRMPENPRIPQYGDFEHITDFRSALEAVREAQAGFDAMPADVRARFQNDPQLLLQFMADDANRGEAAKLGLIKSVDIPVVKEETIPVADVPPKEK